MFCPKIYLKHDVFQKADEIEIFEHIDENQLSTFNYENGFLVRKTRHSLLLTFWHDFDVFHWPITGGVIKCQKGHGHGICYNCDQKTFKVRS